MRSDLVLDRIEGLCDQILRWSGHYSKKDQVDTAIKLLNVATADYLAARAEEPPPDLGIHVGDSAAMGDHFG